MDTVIVNGTSALASVIDDWRKVLGVLGRSQDL